jgi:endonuclease/exonuclease/phosphatase family metal-dependent hydrolase
MKTSFRLFLTFAFCLGMGLPLAVSADDDFITVRIATYNVEFSSRATAEEIGKMLESYNLDIIGFTEAPGGDWIERVGKVLDMKYSYVGEIPSANHEDKYKAILSKTPLDNTEEYRFEVDWGWNPASAVKVVTIIDDVPITFYCIHFCTAGRTKGHAYLFVDNVLLKDKSERIIVGGDFNNQIGERGMNKFERAGMRLLWYDLNIDASKLSTYIHFNEPDNPGYVIDHILYNTSSKGLVIDGGIIELVRPLSDHKPIWAEIKFPR